MSSSQSNEAAWETAKLTWSKYIRLLDPIISDDEAFLKKEAMINEIARFSLANLRVVVNLDEIKKDGLEDHLDVILAHEVGHHVLAPGNLVTLARLVNFLTGMFEPVVAGYVVNIFSDLLVNDFLYIQRGMPVDAVYKMLKSAAMKTGKIKIDDQFWSLYMRIYEILWRLPVDTLTTPVLPSIERDAKIAARVLRTYSKRWFTCLKNLSYIFKPYFPIENASLQFGLPLIDKIVAGEGALDKMGGFATVSDEESDKPNPRAYDGVLGRPDKNAPQHGVTNQPRQPTDYLNTLINIGAISDSERTRALIQYYTELAMPHVIPFPTIDKATIEPINEGSDRWTVGEELIDIDLFESIKESPIIIPGVTTRKLIMGEDKGFEQQKVPVDIDIYQDTSGSMGDPGCGVSYTTIAAFIIVLSALRAGASVQATAWSGPDQAVSTSGFSKNKEEILKTILFYHGDGTQFPCQVLERYEKRPKNAPPVHIIVTSDDDISSMISDYEVKTKAGVEKRNGYETMKKAVQHGKAKGSLLLCIPFMNDNTKNTIKDLQKIGFEYFNVADWQQIIAWAKAFSKKHFSS